MGKVREYSNGEVTIVWKPDLCLHSEKCIHNLPSVFDKDGRPWINASGASTNDIIEQIKTCPSGALSTYLNSVGKTEENQNPSPSVNLKCVPNGPILLKGAIQITMPDGKEENIDKAIALCRCGASGNKPFCDGSHKKVVFEG